MSDTDQAPLRNGGRMAAGTAIMPIIPRNLDEVATLAKVAIMSGLQLGPTARRKSSTDDDAGEHDVVEEENRRIAMATMIIMQGLEVGLSPVQALESIAIINGRKLIWGDAVPALLWSKGFRIEERFSGGDIDAPTDGLTAHCKITRPDGTTIERSFSVAQAKRARLWDEREKIMKWGKNWQTKKSEKYEADNDSPWYRFPTRMLQMRARGFCTKDGASDVMRGLYIREEYEGDVIDVTPDDARLESSEPASPPTPPTPPVPPDPGAP